MMYDLQNELPYDLRYDPQYGLRPTRLHMTRSVERTQT